MVNTVVFEVRLLNPEKFSEKLPPAIPAALIPHMISASVQRLIIAFIKMNILIYSFYERKTQNASRLRPRSLEKKQKPTPPSEVVHLSAAKVVVLRETTKFLWGKNG